MVGVHSGGMSSEATPEEEPQQDGDAGSQPDGRLWSVYRSYIGEPETRRDVYLGFGLFFSGITLGLVGLGLFVFSGAQPFGSDLFWQLREIAVVAALLALPAVGTSVAVLLPVGQRTMGASIVGSVVCLAGAVWFTGVYPYGWEGTGNDVGVISTYAAGLVLLAASTGSALVAQYVDRVAPGETEVVGASADTEDESVSDEQVEADIEAAMSDSSLTWGGVEKQSNTKRLKLDMPDPNTELDDAQADSTTKTRSDRDDVDDAVSGLRQLQGGERETARAQSPDDQVDALTEFREQRDEEDELETGVDSERGLLGRLRERLLG